MNEALRYRPNDLTARHYLALVYASNGDWDRAQAQLEALKQSLPSDAVLRDNLERVAQTRAVGATAARVALD